MFWKYWNFFWVLGYYTPAINDSSVHRLTSSNNRLMFSFLNCIFWASILEKCITSSLLSCVHRMNTHQIVDLWLNPLHDKKKPDDGSHCCWTEPGRTNYLGFKSNCKSSSNSFDVNTSKLCLMSKIQVTTFDQTCSLVKVLLRSSFVQLLKHFQSPFNYDFDVFT